MSGHTPPPAEGVRLLWPEIPARVRAAVEGWLGSSVIEAISQPTGFTPGMAVRLKTSNGRRVFVKAIGPEPNSIGPDIYRTEAAKVAALKTVPSVPELLWTYDEGEGGWVALAFQDIEGRNPAQPWRMDEFERVVEALIGLSDDLTPSPLSPQSAGTAADMFATDLRGWQHLREQQTSDPRVLDSWSARNLGELARIEATAADAVAGDTLLHLDIRADNILLSPERVWFVDWPSACVGAPWVDILAFAPSVAMQGGPLPEDVIARHPACRAADADAVTAVIVAIAGYFTHSSLQPAPPGLPTVRAFQAAQGRVAREWLARHTGWA
jgi:hypothetical protein